MARRESLIGGLAWSLGTNVLEGQSVVVGPSKASASQGPSVGSFSGDSFVEEKRYAE